MRIFIGWDSRFPESAEVLRYSIQKYASIVLDIRYLRLDELNFNRLHDPKASTEFTYSRFLVPYLCGFKGRAIFMDSDMLCLGDIKELDHLEMNDYALRVVKHDYQPVNTIKMYGCEQSSYPRKNWSSLMIMNCEKLGLWSKEIVETQSGAYLHRFQDIPDSQIGDIPENWNTLDWMDSKTKLIHYTNGGPWLEAYKNHPHSDIWFSARDEMISSQV